MAYIKKERLLAELLDMSVINKLQISRDIIEKFRRIVDSQPTADVVEVRHGEWKLSRYVYGTGMIVIPLEYKCSLCGKGTPLKMNYCPECGAKMDGGEKE